MGAICRLETGSEFTGLRRIHSRIVVARFHQNRRIFRTIHYVVVRRIGVKRLELCSVLHGSKLSGVELAIWIQLYAEYVVEADQGDDSAKLLTSCVISAPMSRPPFEPPRAAMWAGELQWLSIRYCAQAEKSSKTFCFLVRFPATCHELPYSAPPRMLVTTSV